MKRDSSIIIIKAPTGIGKTEMILDMDDVVIACPTHNLKDELCRRAIAKGHDFYPTPKLILQNQVYQYTYNHLQNIGAYQEALRYVKALAEIKSIKEAQDYLSAMEEISNTDKNIITTHKRLLLEKQFSDKKSTYIFDEDPLTYCIPSGTIILEDLINLNRFLNGEVSKFVKHCISTIMNSNENEVIDFNKDASRLGPQKQTIETHATKTIFNQINSNVLDFLFTDYTPFVKKNIKGKVQVYYIKKVQFPKNKKVIILSATADSFIYEKLYPERNIIIHEIGNIELKGKIIQIENYSFSRAQLNIGRGMKHHNLAKAISGELSVITYKKVKMNFINPNVHFGALRGHNNLAAQNIIIVGTPREHETKYLLYARILNLQYKTTEQKNMRCEYNGFEFNFYAYIDDNLRNLQFKLIEAELVQAIGRARLLWHDCTVTVLSNFPIVGAERKWLSPEEEDDLIKSLEDAKHGNVENKNTLQRIECQI